MTIAANKDNQVVTLPDNSKITLRKGSILHYPKQFAAAERNVKLEGEAFFEVARNEKSPFIIDAQAASVKVLGTSFIVKCNEAAASVVVKTGKVQMTDQTNKNAYLILTPGEKGSLKNGALTEENVPVDNYMYWQTGIMQFSNTPLKNVVQQLNEITDSSIVVNTSVPQEVQAQLINISFHHQTVEEMLNDICLITLTGWHKTGNTYIINAK
jgi:ferric-dicitrate binding protein FerR (iron transport regulator)